MPKTYHRSQNQYAQRKETDHSEAHQRQRPAETEVILCIASAHARTRYRDKYTEEAKYASPRTKEQVSSLPEAAGHLVM